MRDRALAAARPTLFAAAACRSRSNISTSLPHRHRENKACREIPACIYLSALASTPRATRVSPRERLSICNRRRPSRPGTALAAATCVALEQTPRALLASVATSPAQAQRENPDREIDSPGRARAERLRRNDLDRMSVAHARVVLAKCSGYRIEFEEDFLAPRRESASTRGLQK